MGTIAMRVPVSAQPSARVVKWLANGRDDLWGHRATRAGIEITAQQVGGSDRGVKEKEPTGGDAHTRNSRDSFPAARRYRACQGATIP